MPQATAKSRYNSMVSHRSFYLHEAKKSADLTIPALMPETMDVRDLPRTQRKLPKPYQSLGARGVNNLASKLLLTLLPPTSAFFRYEIDPRAFVGMEAEREAEVRTDLSRRLAKRERQILREVETQGIRVKAFVAIKHLLVTGNVLLYFPPSGGVQLFPMNSYGVARDGEGEPIEFVYVEVLDKDTVSPEISAVLEMKDLEEAGRKADDKGRNTVHLYTHVVREGEAYKISQQLSDGTEVRAGSVPVAESPWLILRYTSVDGEDWGRAFVEEYRGDLASYETLSKALQFASVNASKLVPLVNPNGTVTTQQLNNAENGQALAGGPDDVSFLHIDKSADFNFALTMWQDLNRQLSADFLLNSSFQRPGERVTAEEIRTMAEELEDSLGGVFSTLSQDFQLPLARRLESQLVRRKSIPRLPKNVVEPAVVTGLAAIGRGQDGQKLRTLLVNIQEAEAVRPGVSRYFDAGELARRIGINSGVDLDGLMKTEKDVQNEIQAEQVQQQSATVLEKGAAGAAGPIGELIAQRAQAGGGLGSLIPGQGGQQGPAQG